MNVVDVLKERGFIEQCTDEEGLREFLSLPQTVYIGFDPTASSFHLGSLIPIFILAHFQRCGHRPIAVVGGATGLIGDPSGRFSERNMLEEQVIQSYLVSLKAQLSHFIDFTGEKYQPAAILCNNADWHKKVSYLEWLRDTGKLFTVNYMVAKESIRRRFEDRDQGISYTEFSYMLIQAKDFHHLYETYGCRVQAGGSDQWGNITAGIDLIRRKGGEQAYGLTCPLLTAASGQKFGKSEEGAIWLDKKLTSIWDFYQYFVRTEDHDAERYLKLFTFLSLEEIQKLIHDLRQNPELRIAQKRLAFEVTRIVHGEEQAMKMQRGAESLYSGRLEELDSDLVLQVFSEGPIAEISQSDLEIGIPIVEFAARTGLVKSKGEAKRQLKASAIYLNDKKVEEERVVTKADILPSRTIILRHGKKNYLVIKIQE